MPNVDLDAIRDDIISRYQGGESLRSIARNLHVSGERLKKKLTAWGVETRDHSEAMRLRPGWKYDEGFVRLWS